MSNRIYILNKLRHNMRNLTAALHQSLVNGNRTHLHCARRFVDSRLP